MDIWWNFQQLIGLPQPQAVEMHGTSLQQPAHSPKPGRVPLPHEPLPSAHAGQPRGIVHRPAYETAGVSRSYFCVHVCVCVIPLL